MHYRGFVLVSEPTDEAIAAAMEPHREGYNEDTDEFFGHWDWYRAGGRYDGYLVSDEEMKARETDNGFNFQPENKRADRNCCLAKDVPSDRRAVYFFVADGKWTKRESYDANAPSKWDEGGKGAFVETHGFGDMLDAALAANPEHWVVVIDAHS